jgi:hypothetical protein
VADFHSLHTDCRAFTSSCLVVASDNSYSSASGLKSTLKCGSLPTELLKVKVKVTLRLTVSQSVSQSVSLGFEPHLGLMTRYVLLFDSYGLVLWGALSDETYAAGPCQRSLSRVRVP